MAQFVPVKLDVDTEEYRQWRQDHASEGSRIPILYIVRGDGETLYGKSGPLTGDALPSMLLKALQYSGLILSEKNARTLTTTANRFEQLKDSGDIAAAVKTLNKVKKLGEPGKIPSYAASASRLNELVNQMADDMKAQLKALTTTLEEGSTPEQLQAILDFLEIRRDHGALKLIKTDLSAFQKQLSTNDEHSQMSREAKILDAARIAKTKSSKARAAQKLRDLISNTRIEEVKSAAEQLLDEIENEAE